MMLIAIVVQFTRVTTVRDSSDLEVEDQKSIIGKVLIQFSPIRNVYNLCRLDNPDDRNVLFV